MKTHDTNDLGVSMLQSIFKAGERVEAQFAQSISWRPTRVMSPTQVGFESN